MALSYFGGERNVGSFPLFLFCFFNRNMSLKLREDQEVFDVLFFDTFYSMFKERFIELLLFIF